MLGPIWRILRWMLGLSLEATLTDRERGIFDYWDGKRHRRADPMAVLRSLNDHPEFDLASTPQLAESGALEAVKITCDASRAAFGIKTLDEGGLTEVECIDVMVAFFDFCAALKKNSRAMPTSPEPTELPPSDASTIPPGSGSGSIASEPTAALPPG